MAGYAHETGSTEADLEKWSQPKPTPFDASIYPKPDRIVSGLPSWFRILDRLKAKAIIGHPT